MVAGLSEDEAANTRQTLDDLKSDAVSYAGKVTGFGILTTVIATLIGTSGAAWLMDRFFQSFFAEIPVFISFCVAMDWIFPLLCSLFFASAALVQILKVFLKKKLEAIAVLEKQTEGS
ncbi:MAG: hypothetical protein LBI34_00975 [Puniceicoccales bacterium]|jgi:hypothetical protein|nr:hypothetical protein [Puniceicoccales bacterium]